MKESLSKKAFNSRKKQGEIARVSSISDNRYALERYMKYRKDVLRITNIGDGIELDIFSYSFVPDKGVKVQIRVLGNSLAVYYNKQLVGYVVNDCIGYHFLKNTASKTGLCSASAYLLGRAIKSMPNNRGLYRTISVKM